MWQNLHMSKYYFLAKNGRCGILGACCGLLCGAMGALALVGWHTGNPFLVGIHAGFMPVQYPSALCFLLNGLGLFSFSLRKSRAAAAVPGALGGTLALVMCAAHLAGWSAEFGRFLPPLPETAGFTAGISPSRTAAGLALAGAGVFFIGLPETVKARLPLIWISGSSAAAVGLMAFLAYQLGVSIVFLAGDPAGMAFRSSCGLMILGGGILSAGWPGWSRLTDERWLPVPFGIAAAVASLTLWQELAADRSRFVKSLAAVTARNAAQDIRGRFAFCVRSLNRIRDRWAENPPAPHSGLVRDARDCLHDEPIFEAIGHTDASCMVDWAETARDAESWQGRNLLKTDHWDAAAAIEDSIRNRRMLVSPIHPVRKDQAGIIILLPLFAEDAFQGFVFGVLRLQGLERSSPEPPAFGICRVSVFENGRLVMGKIPAHPMETALHGESSLEFRGRVWRFVAQPESAALPGSGTPLMIFWLGLLLGTAMAGAVRGFQQAIWRSRIATQPICGSKRRSRKSSSRNIN